MILRYYLRMKLRLISFALCPYVQRAAILLHEKGVAHETTAIDLQQKPDWFAKISPRGKVPVLVADDVAIFESQAICEFLDEVCDPPRLMPADPVERARDRGWFQFAEDVFGPIYRRMFASEESVYEKAGRDLSAAFERLEQDFTGRRFLSGDGSRFGMADVAMAPAFAKLSVLKNLGDFELPEKLVAIRSWAERLRERDSVKASIPDRYDALSIEVMRRRGSALLERLGAGVPRLDG
jgi:glutathione S-transferase